jgi:iron complex outermembrane receptor protein
VIFLLLFSFPVFAQQDAVTVTGTRVERPTLEVPASIDRIDGDELRSMRPQINLSESLGRVPGIVVQNRQNYAQDLQVTSRGFGARSTFGIRGLRLITDGIPASFPDGQGQVSHFDLGSASRIEVLRGPFSVLYGNAAGGVVNLVTDVPEPGASGDFSLGSFKTTRLGLKVAAEGGLVSVARFHTNGYRQHSAADREQLNARLDLGPAGGTRFSLTANVFASPETQDPLGLTRADMNANPRQVVAPALQFDTRKSAAQRQLGASLGSRVAGWTLNASLYGGHRDVRQYLAIPTATQAGALHSGGVVDLDRNYGGGALRLSREAALLGRPLTLSLGGELEHMVERRRGFLNNNGSIGGLKRDEDDTVTSAGIYAQGEWRFAERWIALAGLRHSAVRFRTEDYFVAGANGDDSGRKSYHATTPAAGLLYRVTPTTSVYANYGRGFETPTFAELAYRAPGAGAGLNFGLAASRSRHLEAGVKTVLAGRLRVNAALFDIATRDEIAIDTNGGGRSSFKNVGRTHRGGFEFGAEASLPLGFEAGFAWTRLEAKFRDSFTTTITPGVTVLVPAGSYLPGVPRSFLHAELRWRHAPSGFAGAAEFQRKARVWVNDFNGEAADAYGTFNLAGGFTQNYGPWRVQEYLRVDNLTNRRYAGSVVVNDSNSRFYEPAPGRNATLGAQARYSF